MQTMAELKRWYIERVLHSVHGHRTKACKILDMPRTTLHRTLQRWETEKRLAQLRSGRST